MFHFSTKFQDTKIIVLEENYRSIEDVLAIARTTIDRNNSRIVKLIPSLEKPLISKIDHPSGRAEFVSYPTFVEEQMAVLDGIRAHHATGVEYEEMAILVRTNREVSAWSELLAKAQIPYESREKGNLLDTEEMALFEHILRVTEMVVVPDRSLIFVLRSGIFDVEKSDIYRLIRQLSDLNFNRKLKFTLFDLLIREDIRDLVFAERAPIWSEVTNKLIHLREK
ncbi:MAG: 3'-5' exonuclease [Patescibacteria group bacterium]